MGLFRTLFGIGKKPTKRGKQLATGHAAADPAPSHILPPFAPWYFRDDDWTYVRVAAGTGRPEGLMPASGYSKLQVKGLNIGDYEAAEFLKLLDPEQVSLALEREPTEEFPSTVAVYGRPRNGKPFFKLGNVPGEVVEALNAEYTEDLPLGAEMRGAAQKNTKEAVFSITFALLYPKAPERKKYART